MSISSHVGHARILHHAWRGTSHHLRIRSGVEATLWGHTSKLLLVKHHLLLLLLLLVGLGPCLLVVELGPSIAIAAKLSLEHGESGRARATTCRIDSEENLLERDGKGVYQ